MTWIRTLMGAALMLCMMTTSTLAQGRGDQSIPLHFQLLTTSTCATSSSPAFYISWRAYNDAEHMRDLEKQIKELEQYVMIEQYLKEGEAALLQAIALGGGPALEDLATIMGIPSSQRLVWRNRLRTQRTELTTIISHPNASQRARRLHRVLASTAQRRAPYYVQNTLQSTEVTP